MPWQPDGRYYGFEKEAIHAFAPAVSGVYGLYNFDYQLFIGEADNIREALLRHLDRDHSRSPRFQPTGFMFKTCTAEVRERNAEALIQQYQPVRQNELALSDTLALPLDDRAIEAFFRAWADKNELNSQELNSLNEQIAPKVRRRFYFERSWGVAFAAAFVVSMGVNFYLGILTGMNIQKRAVAVIEKPLARIPLVAPLAKQPALDPAPPSNSAITPASEAANSKIAPMAMKLEVPEASPALGPTSPPAQSGIGSANVAHGSVATTTSKNVDAAPALHGADRDKPWSVQVAASVEKDVATMMAQRLSAKGNEVYVVATEVNGQTWYRVRVGRLTARAEAEQLRQVLGVNEGLHAAYLARD